MFLDEELEQILQDNTIGDTETNVRLVNACKARWADPNKEGISAFINSLKRTDNSWRLFCKKHPEYDPEGYRRVVLGMATGEEKLVLKQILKWQ